MCSLTPTAVGWRLEGRLEMAVGPQPLLLLYRILTDTHWATRAVHLERRWQNELCQVQLTADAYGHWWVAGRVAPGLAGCLDAALARSASTHVLAIRRMSLPVGQIGTVAVAEVDPLNLVPSRRIVDYSRQAEDRYFLQSGTVQAEFCVDSGGLVTDFGGEWRRAPDAEAPPPWRLGPA